MAADTCSSLKTENDFQELISTVGDGIPLASEDKEEKDLLSGTLEACLKLLLRQKSATEDKLVTLQEELSLAKERMKKLEHAVKGRGAKAKELAKKLSETTKEKASLVAELKSCHQQLKEELEKKQKFQDMYTESLKIKNSRIKELETENEALRQARRLSAMTNENQMDNAFVFSPGEEFLSTPSASAKPSFNESFESSDQENPNWDPYFGGVKVSQDDIEGMVDNYDMLQLSYTEALKAKNERIKQLESDFQTLKSSRLMSMSQFSSISSDLSIDSYQSDAFPSSYGTSNNFLSTSADAHSLRRARLSVHSQNNSLKRSHHHHRHARSQSLSDRDPRQRSLHDQHLRKSRLNGLRLQKESFDSLSPGSSPTHSGSATPTSTAGSYSGVLGKGLQSLNSEVFNKPRRKGEPRFYDLATDEKQETKGSILSHDEGNSRKLASGTSSGKETKQTRRYMIKRQKDIDTRRNSQSDESQSLPMPTEVENIPTIHLLFPERPIIQISLEENDLIPRDAHAVDSGGSRVLEDNIQKCEGTSHLKSSSSEDGDNFLEVKFSSTHSKFSCSDDEFDHGSETSSHSKSASLTSKQMPITSGCSASSESVPQWKKDLIQKRRKSGSSFKQQPTKSVKDDKPEWVNKVLKGQGSSSSQDCDSPSLYRKVPDTKKAAPFLIEFQSKKRSSS